MYKPNLSPESLLNLEDYERHANSLLPKAHYDYYASGACDEISLQLNREAYQQILLAPRVLRANHGARQLAQRFPPFLFYHKLLRSLLTKYLLSSMAVSVAVLMYLKR